MNMERFRRIMPVMDILIMVVAVLLLGLLRSDAIIIAAYFFIYPYLLLTNRKHLIRYYVLSSAMALAWAIIARDMYGYGDGFISVAGVDAIPLFGWAAGLFGMYALHRSFAERFRIKTFKEGLITFSALAWTLLIAVEILAYHFMGLQNLATGNYPGLPLCDCIHVPFWMKIVYLSMGPLYFTLCHVMKTYKKRKKVSG